MGIPQESFVTVLDRNSSLVRLLKICVVVGLHTETDSEDRVVFYDLPSDEVCADPFIA